MLLILCDVGVVQWMRGSVDLTEIVQVGRTKWTDHSGQTEQNFDFDASSNREPAQWPECCMLMPSGPFGEVWLHKSVILLPRHCNSPGVIWQVHTRTGGWVAYSWRWSLIFVWPGDGGDVISKVQLRFLADLLATISEDPKLMLKPCCN